MIVDRNFAGLVDMGGLYKLDGDLITEESLDIKIPLFVTKSINADGWIEAGESIKAGKWIKTGESIKADWSINAGGSIKAGSVSMYGIKSSKLFIIHGLHFTVWVLDTHIKIGCQLKSKKEWLKFSETATEQDAKSLGDNGKMFAMKDLIIALCGVK